jgi:hypothetical protein
VLDELSAAIDLFDASVAETSSGTLDHVAARAELEELSDEVMRLVGMLDGINRYRFEGDPQLLVAWKTAKHVASGPQVESTVAPSPTPEPTQSPADEDAPVGRGEGVRHAPRRLTPTWRPSTADRSEPYSYRNARIGSTRLALRAGM